MGERWVKGTGPTGWVVWVNMDRVVAIIRSKQDNLTRLFSGGVSVGVDPSGDACCEEFHVACTELPEHFLSTEPPK